MVGRRPNMFGPVYWNTKFFSLNMIGVPFKGCACTAVVPVTVLCRLPILCLAFFKVIYLSLA